MKANSKSFIFDKDIVPEAVGEGIERQIFGYDASILMMKARFEEGSVGYVHHHVHSQVTYIESGEFEINIDGELRTLTAGDAFYVSPNTSHGAVCRQAGTLIDVFSPIREDFLEVEKNS